MSVVDHQPDDRLSELLADQALEGLTYEQELELQSLLAAEGKDRDLSYGVAAAALELSFYTPADLRACPMRLRKRLERAGKVWAAGTASVLRNADVADDPFPEVSRRATRLVFKVGPWLAAAACLTLAVVAWWPSTQSEDLVAVVSRNPDREVMAFTAWDNPEVRGVQGECVWCDDSQHGYLRFVNLPRNDPAVEQYQLWIIDERGMEQRISGGVFDANPEGETIVPIKPGIPVRNAKAFGVTLEKPGGTWVSDMSRKVAIASK